MMTGVRTSPERIAPRRQVVRADVARGEPHARIVAEVDDGVGERLRIGIPGV